MKALVNTISLFIIFMKALKVFSSSHPPALSKAILYLQWAIKTILFPRGRMLKENAVFPFGFCFVSQCGSRVLSRESFLLSFLYFTLT